jgi:lipoyl(octanoyl) transferase
MQESAMEKSDRSMTADGAARPLEVYWMGRMEFATAQALQEEWVGEIRRGERAPSLLLLEHEPVYTIGRTRDQSSLGAPALLPHPVVEINRGGKATYHGPGQLVGYPLLPLEALGKDLHRYLRFLEDLLIEICAHHGVRAQRREGLTGTWVEQKKIASIGVGVRAWISMHGFALNVEPASLAGFQHITPCGLGGVQMTALALEGAVDATVPMVAETATRLLRERWTKPHQDDHSPTTPEEKNSGLI